MIATGIADVTSYFIKGREADQCRGWAGSFGALVTHLQELTPVADRPYRLHQPRYVDGEERYGRYATSLSVVMLLSAGGLATDDTADLTFAAIQHVILRLHLLCGLYQSESTLTPTNIGIMGAVNTLIWIDTMTARYAAIGPCPTLYITSHEELGVYHGFEQTRRITCVA
ncbi:hypothetical protein EJ06DRAFT_68215 [Trichodelitschia bisporula]|uniref:Uncharacterized protein n=1 Tax=Trichodelitschia bisporula TaxID=703511 RepID=A0A6G1HT67_9PEZI|nr:hypothetical protein EJ06DRAFT_68215 [Trichodelitschia bisporula]